MTFPEKISKIESIINAKIIFFSGFFTYNSVTQLKQIIEDNSKSCYDNFLFIMNSKGGDNLYYNENESISENKCIVELLKEKCLKRKEYWILVNKEVASTATLLAFSADKLYVLDNEAKFGPFDPLLNVEPEESLITDNTNFDVDWNNLVITNSNITNQKGIHTINASIRSFSRGKVINNDNRDSAFKYFMNLHKEFKNHSDRKIVTELPDSIKQNIRNINKLINIDLIFELIDEYNELRDLNNYIIYSV